MTGKEYKSYQEDQIAGSGELIRQVGEISKLNMPTLVEVGCSSPFDMQGGGRSVSPILGCPRS